jgi:hypothetical protein
MRMKNLAILAKQVNQTSQWQKWTDFLNKSRLNYLQAHYVAMYQRLPISQTNYRSTKRGYE